jgi:hypothetical protein
MKLLVRVLTVTGCGLLAAVWLSASTVALRVPLGLPGALLVVAILLLSRSFRALQLAAFVGLVWIWHVPVILAAILAVPRVLLVLPGLISTFLAGRRHPRLRWS